MRAFIALTRQHLREHRLPILLWSVTAAFLSYTVASTAKAVADERLLRAFLGQIPPPALKIMGSPNAYRNLIDYFISFKWLGIMPLLGAVFGATAAMGVIARDIEKRTADFLLSLPVPRPFLLAARFTAVGLGLFLLYCASFLSLWAGMARAGLPGSFARYAMYFAGNYCVALAFAAAALLVSLTVREYGPATRYAVILVLGAFSLDVANRILQGPRLFSRILLYGFVYTEETVGRGAFPVAAVVAGLAVTAALLALSMFVLEKKQIPA